jgi:isopentenyl-diphosphate delta-isomerase
MSTLPPERVVLVDSSDREVGTEEKLAAHQRGVLHRAFSVFVLNTSGHLLLQQRAASKYHSAGLWSNTCCGHPRPGERTIDAAGRRLQEEMGISGALACVGSFIYRAPLENGLVEHELDHVFVGDSDATPEMNDAEVSQWRWIDRVTLADEMTTEPQRFTAWLAPALACLGSAQTRFE